MHVRYAYLDLEAEYGCPGPGQQSGAEKIKTNLPDRSHLQATWASSHSLIFDLQSGLVSCLSHRSKSEDYMAILLLELSLSNHCHIIRTLPTVSI